LSKQFSGTCTITACSYSELPQTSEIMPAKQAQTLKAFQNSMLQNGQINQRLSLEESKAELFSGSACHFLQEAGYESK